VVIYSTMIDGWRKGALGTRRLGISVQPEYSGALQRRREGLAMASKTPVQDRRTLEYRALTRLETNPSELLEEYFSFTWLCLLV
jgi:hypothetical protein